MDTKLLIVVIAFVFILLAFAILRKLLGAKGPSSEQRDIYELADSLFTPAERSFFGVLENLNYEGLTIACKVRLADIFKIKRGFGRSERQRALNRVSAKHVDFLLIRKTDGRPMLGIELDDASHQRADRQARDVFVEEVFAASRLPLVRVPAQRTYTVQEIHAILEKALVTS
ncbi:MAG: DUF2726 domain-containing protein [Nibricoccus sp.]